MKAATIVRAPDSEKSANGGVEWSCSSCFFYAVRGRTEGAPPLVEGPALLSALKKLAKHHKKTQTPSAKFLDNTGRGVCPRHRTTL